LAIQADSKELSVTPYFRDTAIYPAPELIKALRKGASYTSKVDIWAMGCIFYRVVFRKPPFESAHVQENNSTLPEESDKPPPKIFGLAGSIQLVREMIVDMLRFEDEERLPAGKVLNILDEALGQPNCDEDDGKSRSSTEWSKVNLNMTFICSIFLPLCEVVPFVVETT